MYKTDRSQVYTFLLFITLLIISGCTKAVEKSPVEPVTLPEITTAYLLEHRIIAYEPKQHEKVIAILPYEIKTFDESYMIYLVARIPDSNSSNDLKEKKPRYYLWLERRAENWRDFLVAQTVALPPLKVDSHFSNIRQGHYYEEYTIDFRLERLAYVQDSDLELLLINQQHFTSTITVPSLYIKAYLEMIKNSSQ